MLHACFGRQSIRPRDHLDKAVAFLLVDYGRLNRAELGENRSKIVLSTSAAISFQTDVQSSGRYVSEHSRYTANEEGSAQH